jgi:hypothetical protein
MEMGGLIDSLIGLIVIAGGWFLKESHAEQKRIYILLNKTREDYATKMELRDDMNRMMEHLHRIEDKIDKLMSK